MDITNAKILFACAALLVVLTGCAAIPGHVTVSRSQFDNSTQIHMKPAVLDMSTQIGLTWNSKLPKDKIIATVIVRDTLNISNGESLHFNVDGDFFHLTSMDTSTMHEYIPGVYNSVAAIPGYNESSRRYEINRGLISKIVESKRTVWKLDLDREYREGDIDTGINMAGTAFKNFLVELDSVTKEGK